MLWTILTIALVFLFFIWIIVAVKYKLQLNKLRREYDAEKDKSKKPTEFFKGREFARFGNGYGKSNRYEESEDRIERARYQQPFSPEQLPKGNYEPKGRSLLQVDASEQIGYDKPKSSRTRIRRRRILRRRK